MTDEVLDELSLTERQKKAVVFLKTSDRITNTGFQEEFGVAKRTAHSDLVELVKKGVLEKVGTTGKGTYYALRKGAKKGPKEP